MGVFLAYLAARLKEPSSYAGLASLLGLIGLHFTDGQLAAISVFLAGAGGVLAVFIPDSSTKA